MKLLTLRDGADAAGVPWETLRTWIKRGWVTLPATTASGRPLVPGATRLLSTIDLARLRITRKLITIGIKPSEAWACAGVIDLGTLADLDQAVSLAARVRAAVYHKGTSAMPGVNFKPEFAAKILEGTKPFTLRKRRKDGREAALGAKLMLFTGMRTKACRQFAETTCVARATIGFNAAGIVSVLHAAVYGVEKGENVVAARFLSGHVIRDLEAATRFPNGPETPARLQRIAEWDGFASWADMWAFHEGQGLNMDGVAVRELFGFGAIHAVDNSPGKGVV